MMEEKSKMCVEDLDKLNVDEKNFRMEYCLCFSKNK